MAMRRWLFALLFLIIPFAPSTTRAQTQAPAVAPSSDQLLEPEQLDALVAPIRLYPDDLLSLVLTASVNHLRWSEGRSSLGRIIRRDRARLSTGQLETGD